MITNKIICRKIINRENRVQLNIANTNKLLKMCNISTFQCCIISLTAIPPKNILQIIDFS